MSDLVGLRQFIAGNGIFGFLDAPWVPIYIGVMFLFHPFFGYAAVAAAIIMVLLALLTQKVSGKRLLDANNSSARAQAAFINNLQNAEVIEGMGMAQLFDQKVMSFLPKQAINKQLPVAPQA